MKDDYYAVLGVDRRASADEIKRAYRRLTLELHPDRHPGDPDIEERFTRVNQAYDTLSDGTKRTKYDATRLRTQTVDLARSFEGRSPREIFSDVFGDVFGARKRERRRGRDIRYTLSVSLAQAALGSSHDIEFEAPGSCESCDGEGIAPGGKPPATCEHCEGRGEVRGAGLLGRRTRCGRCDGTGAVHQDPCKACRGRGTARQSRKFSVRVPAGTTPGTERVVAGEGEPGRFGGEPGDLRVTVNVKPDPDLVMVGDDIVGEVPISIAQAAAGGKVDVRCVDGVVSVDIPRGVTDGARLRLRGKGAGKGGGARGDQMITLVLETPVVDERSPDQQAVSEALSRLEEACTAQEETVLPRRGAYRSRLAAQATKEGGS